MKFSAAILFTLAGCSVAFQISLPQQQRRRQQEELIPLFESTEIANEVVDTVMVDITKQDLLETANNLNEEYGPILIDMNAQKQLKEAVEALEKASSSNGPPTDPSKLIGDWTLVCSTATTGTEEVDKMKNDGIDTSKLPLFKGGIDTSKIPFFNTDPVKEIRNTLNKSVKVQQLIKAAEGEESGNLSRVDHVIQYLPPNELSEFVSTLPDFLQTLNVNPLQVTQEKVVLVHKAELESTVPVMKTKLSLESVVLNVAGKSQILEPDGADVFGVNVPFGDNLQAGSFDTTYMDDDIRVSRSKVGIVDQLRVFVRSSTTESLESDVIPEKDDEDNDDDDIILEVDIDAIEAPSDVKDEVEDIISNDIEASSDSSDDGTSTGDDNSVEDIDPPSDVDSED